MVPGPVVPCGVYSVLWPMILGGHVGLESAVHRGGARKLRRYVVSCFFYTRTDLSVGNRLIGLNGDYLFG